MSRRFAAVAALSSGLVVADAAQAQTPPLALGRFNPAPAGDRLLGVPSPFVAGDPALHVMLLGDYAHNPLLLVRESDDTVVGNTVEHQMFLHLNANLALFDRLGIDINIPLAVLQDGQDAAGVTAPSTAAFGDLRLGARVRLLGEYYDPFQLGIGGYVWLPTGDDQSFVSDGAARGMPYVSVGGRIPRFFWTTAVGTEVRRAQAFANTAQGSMFQFGGGFGFLLGDEEQFQIGPEVSVAISFEDVDSRTTNAEVLGSARYRMGDVELGGGIGPGIAPGIGTPDVRALLMVAYTPQVARDRDGDGILDPVDACPDVPGVAHEDPAKHGCPSDRDGDGILDAVDACPDVPGTAHEDPAKHGCPPDRDGDGVFDAEDACPDIPGIRTQDPATNGCPGDRDGDGIRDDQDACPDEKGVADPDPTKHGCPTSVRVTETEIIILQQVQFDTAKATIRAESDQLLNEVAQVMKEHPEILKIEVQGHTDNRGGKAFNDNLSKNRAKAVMDALVRRGIAPERLSSHGYGLERPIGDNKTEEGRQKNRRVQFLIMEKQPKR